MRIVTAKMMRKHAFVSLAVCLILMTTFLGLATRIISVPERDPSDIVQQESFASSVYAELRERTQETIPVDGAIANNVSSTTTETSIVSQSVVHQHQNQNQQQQQQQQRYVTPSLAELGVRGKPSDTYEHVLMLTRVPGAGSEVIVLLLQRLQGFNAFKHIRLPPGDEGVLSNLQQELLVEEVTSIIRQEAIPLSFDGDVRFFNFTSFGRQSPVYISLVRDPLDPRTIERFEKGESDTIYRGSIAHFCGHDSRCSIRNNNWALEQAKANVIKWYPVVGVLDLLEDSIRVLEKSFPQFFDGASIVYKALKPKKAMTATTTEFLPSNIRKRLTNFLKAEVEFYEWIKSRLLQNVTSTSQKNTITYSSDDEDDKFNQISDFD